MVEGLTARHGGWVDNIQNEMQHSVSRVFKFWREIKNNAYWYAKPSKGIPLKTPYLYLYPFFLLFSETYCFAPRAFQNLETKSAKSMIHSKSQEPIFNRLFFIRHPVPMNCTARQCSPLRRKFMECYINSPALSSTY